MFRKYFLIIFVAFLLVFNIFLFYTDYQNGHRMLTFAALDIGQGDGLFIESPSGVQMLVDSGPIHKIMAPLAKVLPLYDKHINAIMITNPDADHIGGFIDILKNYDVDYIIEPGTFNPSKTYATVEQLVVEKHVKKIIARRGMKLNLGAGAYVNILFPDRDVSTWNSNDGSIVARLSYGNNSVMLTGDATQKIEGIILGENPARLLKSDILKAGHHGSRTSTSSAFVKAVDPNYAVISVGKDNKYGHPHQEILDTLDSFNIKTLRTDLLGTIIFKGDSLDFKLK
ncbi:MAG: MBL fold metallo-hydrolase [Candidatus Nomurabacteria bacterium]|nr:MBL fold metallo-hydrolase [Candidatus Nomurabacteria bacterium]